MKPRPTDEEFVKAARKLYGSDGECEIDKGATVSLSEDGGAYVQAWVWVYDSNVPGYEELEECDECDGLHRKEFIGHE